MGRIDTGGVVKGGLLAGLIINILEMILNGVILAKPWQDAMQALGVTQGGGTIALYVVAAFVIGLLSVWLYAAVRPRLGPGPGTAVEVGIAVWALAFLWPGLGFLALGVFPAGLMVVGLAWELVEVPLATVVGAWIYKEVGSGAAAAAP